MHFNETAARLAITVSGPTPHGHATFFDAKRASVELTGGEPLLRRDVSRLVRLLLHDKRISEIALTTNGVLLADQAQELYDAGLHRVTVSLDTLRPERFRRLGYRSTQSSQSS